MKQRTFFSVLAALVLVLLLTAATGFVALFSDSPLSLLAGGTTANPKADIFVPKTAPVMLSLLVSPKQLDALGQLVTPPQGRRYIHNYFSDLEKNLLSSAGLNYKQDIEAWLGDEITFAVTGWDIDRNTNNGAVPGYLLAIATQNPERSREFLDVFWQSKAIQQGANIVSEPYQGATLIYDKAGVTWASAVVGQQFVLFANSPKVLKDAINNVQVPRLSLHNSEAYQQSLNTVSQPRTLLAFVNLAQVSALKTFDSSVLNAQSRELNTNEILQIALGFNRKGVMAHTTVLFPQANLEAAVPSLTEPVLAMRFIPGEVGVLSAGSDLSGLWNTLASHADTPLFKFVSETISSLGSRWGVDLGQDVFGWVKGEYAIALLPKGDSSKLDWLFVAQKSPQANESIERLDNIAREQGFSVGPLKLADKEVLAWTKLIASDTGGKPQPVGLLAQVRGAHTEAGDYEVFGSSLEVIDHALKAELGSNSLDNSSLAAGIAALPLPNSGYVYLDWGTTEAILKRQFPIFKLVEVAAAPVFQHLRSLTFGLGGSDGAVAKSDVFVLVGS